MSDFLTIGVRTRLTPGYCRQSRIRGERISHPGLEYAIAELRGIVRQDFAVMAMPHPDGTERLIVFYCGEEFFPASVLRGLRKTGLPEPWIPAEKDFLKINRLPYLADGRIDIQKLNAVIQALAVDEAGEHQ